MASLETALALCDLAGDRVSLTFVSPRAEFVLTPLAVGAPFAAASVPRWPLADVADELGARHVAAAIDHVDARERRLRLSDGTALEYEALVLALGARRRAAFPHAHTFFAENSPALLSGVIGDLEQGWSKSLAVVVPPTVNWTLPAYELALRTAATSGRWASTTQRSPSSRPRSTPLALFGPPAATSAAELLDAAGVAIECSAHVNGGLRRLRLAVGPSTAPRGAGRRAAGPGGPPRQRPVARRPRLPGHRRARACARRR